MLWASTSATDDRLWADMAGQAVFAAQDNLVALLAADSVIATAKAQTSLGWPSGGLATKRVVWVNGTVEQFDVDHPYSGAAAGQGKDGTFVLRVMCLVQGPASDYKQVRDEAKVLADAVEAIVDNDRTIGGAVWHAKVTGFGVDEAIPADNERACAIMLDVSCRAWTT